MKKLFLIFSLTILMLSCADSDGNNEECETCDNITTVLVGTKCVPIAEVEACGPDGHAHGEVNGVPDCHCFHGQNTTDINGAPYCLQSECSTTEEKDWDQVACEIFSDQAEEIVLTTDYTIAHMHFEEKMEVVLGETETMGHIPVLQDSAFMLHLSEKDVFVKASLADGTDVEFEREDANSDCSSDIKEVIHIHMENDTGEKFPLILHFRAQNSSNERVFLIVLEEKHNHEE